MSRKSNLLSPASGLTFVNRRRRLWLEKLETRRVLTGPIDTQNRVDVVNAYLDRFVPALNVPLTWTGNTASCVAGTVNQAATDATLEMVNFFRNMSGLNDVFFDSTYNSKAQAAALMMHAQNALSHTPPSNWACYTAAGSEAAGRSNLYLGVRGAAAIRGYIEDPGSGNTAVGHRRWIQYPHTDRMGTGSTSNANALWVITPFVSQPSPTWIAWPPIGFVTKDLVFPRWSLSRANADFARSQVTMTMNNNPVPVRVNTVANGFGLNTLVWEPTLTIPPGTADTRISVSVTNVIVGGSAQSFQYDVIAIAPNLPALSVEFSASSVAENAGTVANFVTVKRNFADTSNSVQVTLTSSDTTEATVPASVTIPAGSDSVTFAITAIDDTLVDGDQSVTITAAANGHASGFKQMLVTDNDTPVLSLTLTPASISEKDGLATATVSRSGSTTSNMVVNLASNDTTEATVPTSVTIPAGAVSATFSITAVDDALFDGTQTVTITASSVGAQNSTATLTVLDDEVATIAIAFAASSISEKNGSTIGTITRTGPTSGSLVVNLSSSDPSEATVPNFVSIAAGSPSATFTVTAIDDLIFDGDQSVTITAAAQGFSNAIASIVVTDDEQLVLALSLAASSISENNGTTTGTVTRTGPTTGSLVVALTSSDTTEAIVPASVTIPAGSTGITFPVTAVDDTLLDGSQTLDITAAANGFASVRISLTVTDDELPALSLSLASASISEKNGTTTATITRSGPTTSSLTVNLTISDATEATVPATVVIPSGSSSTTFTVTAVDDTLVDGSQTVQVKATAAGYQDGFATLIVTDDELPTLGLTLAASSISEKNGSTTGTVTRTGSTTSSLVVALTSNDTSEATVPATVTIEAGAVSATFPVTAQDDTNLDGSQTVVISASAAGFTNGTAVLVVTDDEQPGLAISLANSAISEKNGLTTGTVTRSGPTTSSVTVSLSSSDTTEATVPVNITIAAGATSATFTVSSVDDNLVDGPRVVTISASAAGYQPGNTTLTITDDEQPSLTLSANPKSISEQSGIALATLTRGGSTAEALIVTLASSDTTEATTPATVTIAAGASSVQFTITAVDDTLTDGNQSVQITASAPGIQSASESIVVVDNEQADLVFTNTTISVGETAGTIQLSLIRNTSTATILVISLTSSDPITATVPDTVTFQAGVSSVSVPVTIVNNEIADGPRTTSITASQSNLRSASTLLTINDDETAALTLKFSTTQILETGGVSTATITRNTPVNRAVAVALTSSDLTEAIVPQQVTIPVGATSATFIVQAVNDQIQDGDQTVVINGSAAGMQTATRSLQVIDDETPVFSLELAESSISERDGGTTGTVRLPSAATSSLTVALSSSDTSAATVPTTVTINAGSTTATFAITSVDDATLDGTQSTLISATATGFQTSAQSLSVTDWETLTVSIPQSTVSEASGTIIGSVLRSNADLTESVTVQLISNNLAAARLPARVTIPAGENFANFNVLLVDDAVVDGLQSVTLTASESRYQSVGFVLFISDDDLGSAWTNISKPLDVSNDGNITAFDALLLINQLNTVGAGALAPPTNAPTEFYDVNGDGFLTAMDALIVINYLNNLPSAEAESTDHLNAIDQAIQELVASEFDPYDRRETNLLGLNRIVRRR